MPMGVTAILSTRSQSMRLDGGLQWGLVGEEREPGREQRWWRWRLEAVEEGLSQALSRTTGVRNGRGEEVEGLQFVAK